MYLQILRKDLKRKKAMNVILLVFIILAAVFISAGASNIISVTTALDDYLEITDAPDYLAANMKRAGSVDINEILNSAASAERSSREKILYMESDNISFEAAGKTSANNNAELTLSQITPSNHHLPQSLKEISHYPL